MTSASPARAAILMIGALLTAGCGIFQQAAVLPRAESGTPAASPPSSSPTVQKAQAPTADRRVGDFFVHRFSGSFAEYPLTLTEEVLSGDSNAWLVEFVLSQNEQLERLRVRFDARSGETTSVVRLVGNEETSAGLADYEALMARTIYAADVNEGLVSQSAQTCLIGAEELDCETKTYRVRIGEDAATLSVVHAARYTDRDVSGEVTGDDGTLLYRAELLEARRGSSRPGIAAR